MLQGEQTAILSTFIKLPFVIKVFVLSIFEWPLKTGFTVLKFFSAPKILFKNMCVKGRNAKFTCFSPRLRTILVTNLMRFVASLQNLSKDQTYKNYPACKELNSGFEL